MAEIKVYAPNRDFNGRVGNAQFANGVAHVEEALSVAEMAYFRRAGYGIGAPPPAVPEKPAPYVPEAPAMVRGPESLDAAVQPNAGGPVSDAYLPPTNAGEADPHGPLVVSPGIHGVGPGPIRPGEVYIDDVARQEKEETELDELVLVEGAPATIASAIDEEGDASDAAKAAAGPARSATKAAWVDFAVSRGADRDAAEDMTKAALIEQHGS
ncbi:MAG: hypothetical protein QOJ81_541 [Chloroflexota bacterium]|jgi:hypothetical protein|nr:hypothetical protein [Chloroflexota bacterium]